VLYAHVFDVGLFEAEAVEGFQQVAGGAQALDGAFEDVLRVASVSMIRGLVSVRLDSSGR